MKKCLVCALVAVAFALNAEAKDKDKYKDKDEDKDYNGPLVSVPDGGSTILLLGTGLAAIAIANRCRLLTFTHVTDGQE